MMTFPKNPLAPVRHARRLLGASILLLAVACGGGVSTKDPFTPDRILVFGDDLSVLAKAGNAEGFRVGAKYSLNVVNATDTTAYDCGTYPVWPQAMAGYYGMGFPECNQGIESSPRARTFAEAGKDVAGVIAQIDAYQAAGSNFFDSDLVTVQAGMFDVKAAYETYAAGGQSFDAAKLQVQAAAIALGKRIKQVTDTGAKVIFSTIPDVSLSPWAAARDPALVLRLVNDFNEKLRVTVPNDGRKVGLVEADARTQIQYNDPTLYGLVNVTAASATRPRPQARCPTARTAAPAP
jgi:hypothetical protein